MKLTNRLVKRRTTGAAPGQGRRGRRGPRPGHAADASRDRIVAAAAREFAARGFAATSVDRIAAAARLNKAMIYYHFQSKRGLYVEILRDMFAAVNARVTAVAAADLEPEEQIREFVAAVAAEAEARPHFPPIWFREIADGGAHLDEATLTQIGGILGALKSIVAAGGRAGRFAAINPMLLHAGIVAPVLLYFASDGLRRRVERAGVRGVSEIETASVVAHVQRVALGLLRQEM